MAQFENQKFIYLEGIPKFESGIEVIVRSLDDKRKISIRPAGTDETGVAIDYKRFELADYVKGDNESFLMLQYTPKNENSIRRTIKLKPLPGTEPQMEAVIHEMNRRSQGQITNDEKKTEENICNIEPSAFDGGLLQLIGWQFLGGLVTFFTLGICYPWAVCMIYEWETKHTVINGHRLTFDGKAIQLFGNWIKWALLTLITLGIYGFWVGISIRKWKVKHTHFAD